MLLSCSSMLVNFLILSCVPTAYGQQFHFSQTSDHDLDTTGHNSKLLELHKALVDIESITGNEHDVGVFLSNYLREHHLTVDCFSDGSSANRDDGERFNILAYYGKRSNIHTILTSHIDTVPPYIPYSHSHKNHTISGRGSVDDKGSVAAQTRAFLELHSSHAELLSAKGLALLFVVGEEVNGDGMRLANELNLEPKAVIFGEPTEGKLCEGHKGITMVSLVAHGTAAHSGYPWLGQSANDIMIAALSAVRMLEQSGKLPSSEKFGNTTINIGKIVGGVAANVVSERAQADITVRIAAGTPELVNSLILQAVKEATKDLLSDKGGLDVNFSVQGYPPQSLSHDVEGFEPITVNYGTDIPNWHGSGKRYLYGPGSILVSHGPHEGLKVEELEKAVEDYKRIVLATMQ